MKITSGVLPCDMFFAFFYDAIEKILRRDGIFSPSRRRKLSVEPSFSCQVGGDFRLSVQSTYIYNELDRQTKILSWHIDYETGSAYELFI